MIDVNAYNARYHQYFGEQYGLRADHNTTSYLPVNKLMDNLSGVIRVLSADNSDDFRRMLNDTLPGMALQSLLFEVQSRLYLAEQSETQNELPY